MASAVDQLININIKISEASLENNFSRILFLDTKRRTLLRTLATNPDCRSDESSLTILSDTAQQNQELMTLITAKMTALTRVTGNKIKMLRSYRMTK